MMQERSSKIKKIRSKCTSRIYFKYLINQNQFQVSTIKNNNLNRRYWTITFTSEINKKRKYNEIEDDEKEMLKKELEKISKEKEVPECEIDCLEINKKV